MKCVFFEIDLMSISDCLHPAFLNGLPILVFHILYASARQDYLFS